MDAVIVALLIGLPLAAFAAGVIYQKYVISEAEALKQHVTDAADSTKRFVLDTEKRIVTEVTTLKSQLDFIKKI